MGYSTNPATAAKMRPYLQALKEGGEVKFRTPPNMAHWFAYKMREALSILRVRPGAAGITLDSDYKIKVVSSQEVLAVPDWNKNVEVVSEGPSVRTTADIRETIGVEDIKARWNIRSPLEDRIYFPNANLVWDELLTLYEWATNEGAIIFENAGAITLLPLEGNEELADLGWTPEDL